MLNVSWVKVFKIETRGGMIKLDWKHEKLRPGKWGSFRTIIEKMPNIKFMRRRKHFMIIMRDAYNSFNKIEILNINHERIKSTK